ncbi:MAG: hypothetical protein AAF446_00750, partial [Pseudomonadota bacterium]
DKNGYPHSRFVDLNRFNRTAWFFVLHTIHLKKNLGYSPKTSLRRGEITPVIRYVFSAGFKGFTHSSASLWQDSNHLCKVPYTPALYSNPYSQSYRNQAIVSKSLAMT